MWVTHACFFHFNNAPSCRFLSCLIGIYTQCWMIQGSMASCSFCNHQPCRHSCAMNVNCLLLQMACICQISFSTCVAQLHALFCSGHLEKKHAISFADLQLVQRLRGPLPVLIEDQTWEVRFGMSPEFLCELPGEQTHDSCTQHLSLHWLWLYYWIWCIIM